jgi:hypothetical protein
MLPVSGKRMSIAVEREVEREVERVESIALSHDNLGFQNGGLDFFVRQDDSAIAEDFV